MLGAESLAERSGAISAISPNYPSSERELIDSCRANQLIDGSHRFGKGLWMPIDTTTFKGPSWEFAIYGRYGIHRLGSIETELVVAKCGFDLMDGKMIITHTPQGAKKGRLPRRERQELLQSNFRSEMLGHMIATARALGIEEIEGRGAENHEKVVNGWVDLQRAIVIIDEQFTLAGFSPNKKGDFVLKL